MGDRGRVNRDEWQARWWLCKANRNDSTTNQPNTDLLANTGSACLAKHQQGEWQNFHCKQSSQFALVSGRRPKARPGLGKGRRRQRNGPQPQSRQPRVQWRALAHACRWIPSSALSPSRPLCLLVLPPMSNRDRGCTMQELRALSFGPQKYATPGTDFLRDAHVRPDRTCLHRRLQRPSWMHLPSYMPYSNGPGSYTGTS